MEDMTNVKSLYSPKFEHDNCGIGAVVNIKGKKSHDTVANALTIVETLEHRAGKDAEGKTGDGVGILLQISHKFFKKIAAAELGITLGEDEYFVIGDNCNNSEDSRFTNIGAVTKEAIEGKVIARISGLKLKKVQ